jgi:hypothetical protein
VHYLIWKKFWKSKTQLGRDYWKSMVERHQDKLVEYLGLWGVPNYRLSEPDLAV